MAYVEVVIKRPKGFWCGGIEHFGTTYYAPGYLSEDQVNTIIADRSGHISTRMVDEVPEGVTIVGKKPAPSSPAKQYAMNVEDTCIKIAEAQSIEDVNALVKDDDRKTTQKAAAARIAELTKPLE